MDLVYEYKLMSWYFYKCILIKWSKWKNEMVFPYCIFPTMYIEGSVEIENHHLRSITVMVISHKNDQ